jgi:hypothetical protein
MASQDIQPDESISQVSVEETVSTNDTPSHVGSSSQSGFWSQFSPAVNLGDNMVVIYNDPIPLARSRDILQVAVRMSMV